MKIPARVLFYGSGLPLPKPVPLRAGPLRLLFEGGDLRYARLGSVEILRRVYGAVRDQNWGTPAGVISGLSVERGRDSFEIRYTSTHLQGPIHFVWQATIRGEASGTICFRMDGLAHSTFLRSRIGLCLLHPIRECSGVACRVETAGGVTATAVFPEQISADLPITNFREMQALSYEVVPGLRAKFEFEGDLFETEDQRNWTDASYKTFSTPANLPVPVEVERGTRISQSVTLRLEGRPVAVESAPTRQAIHITLGGKASGRVPRIGLGVASHKQPLSDQQTARLKALKLSHLRVDVDFSRPDWRRDLERAARAARALGAALEIALVDCDEEKLKDLSSVIQASRAKVGAWLLFPASPKLIPLLRSIGPRAKIGSGTNADFYHFNQSPPGGALFDFATYSIHPQTHASDSRSLVESLEMQAQTAAQARRLAGGLPVAVSPVTLKPRFNPDATAPEPPPAPGELPSQVDARQMSLFGAAWTAVSLKYLAEGGAVSVTFYETTGWRGVMELAEGPALPRMFRSIANSVFPLYHVLADAAEFAGGQVLPTRSSNPLAVDGLALRTTGNTRVIVANFTGEPQRVVLAGAGERGFVRLLDERSAPEAIASPEKYRRRKPRSVRLTNLLLPRYAVARIDLQED
jgi:D-apionolactonase